MLFCYNTFSIKTNEVAQDIICHRALAGAGKTYTMLGTEKEPGIMVLTLNNLFKKIQDTSDDMIYRVTMAYMEVGPMYTV